MPQDDPNASFHNEDGWNGSVVDFRIEGRVGSDYPRRAFTFTSNPHGWRFTVHGETDGGAAAFRPTVFDIGADKHGDPFTLKGPADAWRVIALCVARFNQCRVFWHALPSEPGAVPVITDRRAAVAAAYEQHKAAAQAIRRAEKKPTRKKKQRKSGKRKATLRKTR